MFKRTSGVLMHITSLPGQFWTGTIGAEARSFAEMLAEAGCTYWQMLPLNHLSEQNSPYTNLSLFALNPNIIDLNALVDRGVLEQDEVSEAFVVTGQKVSEFRMLERKKWILLRKAFSRENEQTLREVERFVRENEGWIHAYALFVVLKNQYTDLLWNEWPVIGLRLHKDDAIRKALEEYRSDISFWQYVQYVAYQQWFEFKAYVNALGVKIIGDLPIYASFDSADVWACNHLFQLNTKHIPKHVAGVPPDYFNRNGQLWGNPLYNWAEMRRDGYRWWMLRIQKALELYDSVRLDHFRGFHSYWAVPVANKTAKKGEWVQGPGMDFVNTIKRYFPSDLFFIEDLGDVDDSVKRFFEASGYPGMRVMQFGFGEEGDPRHQVRSFDQNCIAYTGTHDNNTIIGWYDEAAVQTVAESLQMLCGKNRADLTDQEICRAWIEALFRSDAAHVMVPIQDLLAQNESARMNLPGTSGGNWVYRVDEQLLKNLDVAWLKELNIETKRAPGL